MASPAPSLAKGAGWVINLAIAESAIGRHVHHRPALPQLLSKLEHSHEHLPHDIHNPR